MRFETLQGPFLRRGLGEFMWQISGSSTAKNIFSIWLLPDYIEDSWICDYASRNFSESLKVDTMETLLASFKKLLSLSSMTP